MRLEYWPALITLFVGLGGFVQLHFGITRDSTTLFGMFSSLDTGLTRRIEVINSATGRPLKIPDNLVQRVRFTKILPTQQQISRIGRAVSCAYDSTPVTVVFYKAVLVRPNKLHFSPVVQVEDLRC
jgi:hypothetical protein